MPTLMEATNAFLANIEKSKRPLTYKAYRNALLGNANGFLPVVRKWVKYDDPIDKLTEKHAMQYMQEILDLAPATRQLNAAALRRFYAFLAGNDWATVSQERLNFLLEGANVLTPVHSQVKFDKAHVLEFLNCVKIWVPNGNTPIRHLRNLRDRAFILMLAESGLRVHEACKLRIKDVDFKNESGVVIGKGNKQARFKIGHHAIEAIQAYIQNREKFIHVLPEQNVFARHDRRAGSQRLLPMSTQTGEAIIHEVELRALGTSTLTCHSLRHFFVTHVLDKTRNLKAAQVLARHTNINITERYAHLIDDEIDDQFDDAFND